MVPGALPRADLWLPFQGDRELRNLKTRKRSTQAKAGAGWIADVRHSRTPRSRFGLVWVVCNSSENRSNLAGPYRIS
jgi:hypothetical protein